MGFSGLFLKCCFSSRKTIRLIWDGEPRTATSTLTQLLDSDGLGLSQVLLTHSLPSGYLMASLAKWFLPTCRTSYDFQFQFQLFKYCDVKHVCKCSSLGLLSLFLRPISKGNCIRDAKQPGVGQNIALACFTNCQAEFCLPGSFDFIFLPNIWWSTPPPPRPPFT